MHSARGITDAIVYLPVIEVILPLITFHTSLSMPYTISVNVKAIPSDNPSV